MGSPLAERSRRVFDVSIIRVTTEPSINQLGIMIESLSTDAACTLMTGAEILQISSP